MDHATFLVKLENLENFCAALRQIEGDGPKVLDPEWQKRYQALSQVIGAEIDLLTVE